MQKVKPTASQIYEKIKDEIIFLHMVPGEEISINTLSERLEVSRSPVRDALMRLQGEGLVDMLPQRGCWVSRIDMDRVDEQCFLRRFIDKRAIVLAAGRMKSSDLAEMAYRIQLQKAALAENSPSAFYQNDDAMHRVYFEAASSLRLWDLIMRETGDYRRVRILSFENNDIARKNIEQHEAIYYALKDQDGVLAENMLSAHLEKLAIERDAIVDKHPDYFI